MSDTAARPLEEQLAIWSKEARDDHSPLATVAAHVEPAHTGDANTWQHKVVSSIVALLYEYRLELGAAFRVRFSPPLCGAKGRARARTRTLLHALSLPHHPYPCSCSM